MKIKFKLCAVLCLIIPVLTIYSQTTLTTTGGNGIGSGGSVSYTIGQLVFTTNTGSTGTLAQGVQQPYEISVVTALEEAKEINLLFTVYPNPTTDYLTLKTGENNLTNLSYWLYGVGGNLLETKKILAEETQISMSNKASGTYFLKITSGTKEIKTFKIIKN